jgi:hypothetical protein
MCGYRTGHTFIDELSPRFLGGAMLMNAGLRIRVFLFSACLVILWANLVQAAQTGDTSPAPVPAAIFASKRIFISNAGADSGLFPHPFSGTPDRAYNEFYGFMQGWGRYEIVAAPADADLVFELRLIAPNGPSNANKQKGASDPVPMFRLVIYDAKTRFVLWALTDSIEEAYVQKTHDRDFDESLGMLVGDLKQVVSRAPVSAAR